MARDPGSDHPSLDPQVVATQTFSTAFRGFDTSEVRGYLEALAGLMADAASREDDLARRLGEAEERLANPPPLDEHELTVLLGEETTRVIDAARQAAAEIRTRSEENAARLVREASEEAAVTTVAAEDYASRLRATADEETAGQRTAADEYAAQVRGSADDEMGRLRAEAEADAARMREEAETMLAVRTEEAESSLISIRAEAVQLRTDAEEELASLRASVTAELAELRATATAESDAEIEAARQDGREMVTEARAVRGRMLTDLAGRRRSARSELDQLRATREWLLDVLDAARRRIDEAADDLGGNLPVARLEAHDLAAAESARQDAADDAALEAMINEEPERASVRRRETPDPEPEPAEAVSADPPAPPPSEHASAEPAVSPVPSAESSPEPVEHASVDRVPEQDNGAQATIDLRDVDTDAVDETPGHTVDELFAKIRASRADEVARANEVLADATEPVTGEPVEPDASDASEAPSPSEPTAVAVDVGAAVNGGAEAASGWTPEGVTTLLERRDAATDEIERQLARRLKRILSDEQNELLDGVRRAKGAPTAEEILPETDAHTERYGSAAASDLTLAAATGASFYGDSPVEVSTQVDDIAARLADELVRQLRVRLIRCFADAGGDPGELAERIRACYREWKTQRIADTSRHFVLAAFTRGLFDAAPTATGFRWIVDDGGTPCPDAEDNALQGEVIKGELFPTGDAYPPAHPGCRCLIVPVGADVVSSS